MVSAPVFAAKDPSVLLGRIRRAFPDLRWDTCTFIDAGWDHEVMQLDAAYIFRFPNSPEYLALLKDEIRLLAHITHSIKAPIPQYKYIAKDFSFAGYDMLPGTTLTVAVFDSLPAAKRAAVIHTIADFLSDLHSVDTSELSQFHVSSKEFGGYSDVHSLAATYLRPQLSGDEYAAVSTMLADISSIQGCPQPTRLTHGDFAPKHLLWDGDTLSVIDFSDRSISDPAIDFAELYTYGEDFVQQVYALYQGPDKTPHFLDRAKAYMKAIGIYALSNSYRSDKITRDEAMQLLAIGLHLQIRSPR